MGRRASCSRSGVETMRFSFEVPGKPVPQGSMRSFGHGRMVHSNHQELLPWRAHVAAIADQHVPPMWDTTGPMRVEATFWLPRPKNHHGSKGLKPSAPWWPTGRVGDVDKYARALLDALTDAGVWVDDSQVVLLTAEKSYGPPALWCAIQHLTERQTS